MDFAPPAAATSRGLLGHIESLAVGVLGFSALMLASVNVLLRTFAPQYTVEWGDEVQVYLVVWAVCLSFAAVTAADRHVKADLFVGMMPAAVQRALHMFSNVLGLVLSAVLCWLAYLVTYESWDFGDVSTTTLRFPLWIYQASLPVGMGLMTIAYLRRVLADLGIGRPAP
jgi:TRAP-type C4-dicarboxylate transport system permease small subunit